MKIPFVKMHGIGNDFILMSEKALPKSIDIRRFVQHACHRRFGIGADGLMIAAAIITVMGLRERCAAMVFGVLPVLLIQKHLNIQKTCALKRWPAF